MDDKKDICVYISDQHSWSVQHYAGDSLIRTPNLDRIAKEGTSFMNAYASYPVCVPSRMSFMSCQLASKNGAMGNFSALDSNRTTFAHCLNAAGYETVLCGRMHFVGPDQRHGFSRRIAGDMTQIFHNRPQSMAKERGVHDHTPQGGKNALSLIGSGNSPTLEFDRYVVEHAIEYFSHNYEKPQYVSVGTYGPHHPYVAPDDLFEYYYDKVGLLEDTYDLPEHPAIRGRYVKDTNPEVVRAVRAAYYGMIEFEDQQIGEVYDSFKSYLKRTGRKGVFFYVSDHGDHAGYRGHYDKSTFYEASCHIPMIAAGTDIPVNNIINEAVSLMDLGPTICNICGAEIPPDSDGTSFKDELEKNHNLPDRMIVAEAEGDISYKNDFQYGQMCKWRQYKLIHYDGFDQDDILYDVVNDPMEKVNIIKENEDVAIKMRQKIKDMCTVPVERIRENSEKLKKNLPYLMNCDYDSEERWKVPEKAGHLPNHLVISELCRKDK